MFQNILLILLLTAPGLTLAAPPTTSKAALAAAQRALLSDPNDEMAMANVLRHARAAGGLSVLIETIRTQITGHANPVRLRIVLGHLIRHRSTCDRALQEYKKALQLAPNNPIAHAAVAHCMSELESWTEAIQHLQQAIQHSTRRDQRNKLRADLFDVSLLAGDTQRAMMMYRALAQGKGANAQFAIGVVDKLKNHSLYKQAVQVLREWQVKSRHDPKMHVAIVSELALLLTRLNQANEADTLLQTTLNSLPDEHWARLELQESLVSLHRQQGTLPALIQRVQRWPKTVPNTFLLAQLHEENGDDPQALVYYRKTLKRRPGNLVARDAVLRIVRRNGDRSEVVRIYEKLVKQAGNDPQYALDLARVYFEDGYRDKGMNTLAALTKRYSGDPSIQESILELLLRNDGAQEHIVRVYKTLIRLEPHDLNHRVALGEFYFGEGQSDEALATWGRIGSATSNKERAYVTRARVLAEHDFIDQAVDDFERALALPNARPVVRRELALILEKAERLSDAVAQWETLLNKATRSDYALEREARTHIVSLKARLRTLHVAIQTLSARLANNPNDRHAVLLLVEAHNQGKDFEKSLQVLERYRKNHPQDVEALTLLAELYERLNQPGKSLPLLRELSRLAPDTARQLLGQLARTGLEKHYLPEALSFAQLLVDLHPTDSNAFASLGALLIRRGDLEDALEAYRRSVSLAPSNVNLQLQLAELLERLGKRTELVRRLQNIMRTATDPNDVTDAGRRLLRLATDKEHEKTADILSQAMARTQRKDVYRKLLLELYERFARSLSLSATPHTPAITEQVQRLASRSLKIILDGLNDTDLRVRTHSLRLLMTTRNPQAVPHLNHLLDSHDSVLRSQVIAVLATIGSDSASDALSAVMKRPDRRLQTEIMWALGAIQGPKANKALLSIRNARGMTKHLHAIRAMALGMQGTPAATKPLIQLYRQQSSGIRNIILWSLGLIGDPSAVNFLIKELTLGSAASQRMAIWALGASGSKKGIGPLLPLVLSNHPRHSRAAWRSIAWILTPNTNHKQALREKYLALHDFHRGRLVMRPTPTLTPAIDWPTIDSSPISSLLKTHSTTILQVLREQMSSSDENTRTRTIQALVPNDGHTTSLVLRGMKGTPIPKAWVQPIHAELLKRLELDSAIPVRAAAALALGHLASDDCIKALGMAAKHPSIPLQRAAIVALTGMPQRRAGTVLIAAADGIAAGKDWPTKVRLAHALGNVLVHHPERVSAIAPTLHALANDRAIEVRIAALEALYITDAQYAPPIQVLRKRMQEADASLVQSAIRLLERWALPESTALLQTASQRKNPVIKGAAKAALDRLNKKRAR